MGLGMPEVILILVVALIIFGPRKLPELGKSLGHAMSQFRRASDDFKRTWEQEVEMEKYRDTSSNSSASSNYSSSNDYNSAHDPYSGDPYSGETESANTSTSQSTESLSSGSTETQEPAKAAAANDPKQQHWI